jgi:amino acid transporter
LFCWSKWVRTNWDASTLFYFLGTKYSFLFCQRRNEWFVFLKKKQTKSEGEKHIIIILCGFLLFTFLFIINFLYFITIAYVDWLFFFKNVNICKLSFSRKKKTNPFRKMKNLKQIHLPASFIYTNWLVFFIYIGENWHRLG